MSDITVKTTAGFNNLGVYAKRGSEIVVSAERAKDLLRAGLIEDYTVQKSASAPDNKQAPVAENKSAPTPKAKRVVQPKT